MLHQLRVNRQILDDLTALHLAPMTGMFERLSYLAGLREPASGMYKHERLGVLYGDTPVNEAIGKAHEEVFERILETPLEQQEQDLRAFLRMRAIQAPNSGPNDFNYFAAGLQNCIPREAPSYLRDLFLSNVSALRELLQN